MANPVNPCALIGSFWVRISQYGPFHGNGPIRIFLFWNKAGKFKICNQNREKSVNNIILHIETIRRS